MMSMSRDDCRGEPVSAALENMQAARLPLQNYFGARSARASSCRRSACPTNRVKRYGERRFGSVCQRSPSSYDDGAADGTTGLAGHKVRALVRGEATSSASVLARSADNGPGIHMAKIAVGA